MLVTLTDLLVLLFRMECIKVVHELLLVLHKHLDDLHRLARVSHEHLQ